MLATGIVNALAAALFLYVGVRVSGRYMEKPSLPAQRAFVLWWVCVAAFVFIWHALGPLLVVVQVTTLGVFVVLRYLSYLVISAGIGAMIFFLLYLYTGRRRLITAVSVYYTAVFLLLSYLVVWRGPVEVDVQKWRINLVYEIPPNLPYIATLSLLVLPAVAAGLGYFLLRFRTRDRYMRFRITLVSWSIVVWALSSLLARVFAEDWWQLFTRSGIGLVAAGVVLFAYDTPQGVRRRIGAGTKQEVEKQEARWRRARAERRDEDKRLRKGALERRMRDLL